MRRRTTTKVFIISSVFSAAAVIACGSDRAAAPAQHDPVTLPDSDPSPIDSVRSLVLETYEGSGQTVHPDFLSIPGWPAQRNGLLALTPYPNGMSMYENPVVYTSRDLLRWTVPVPSLNPVVSPSNGYLSDPDIVYDPDSGQVLMYYRQVAAENEIMLMRSRDLFAWSAPVRVVHAPNHEVVSPAVVRRSATDWMMWSVNGHGGCASAESSVELRRSSDGVTWSDPLPVALDQPGFAPWHIEVQWVPSRSEYWALYNAKTTESCNTPALFFATSKDGVTWTTYPSPLLERGDAPQFRDIVYRSTFVFNSETGIVTFWFSGATYDGARFIWTSAIERRRVADVFAAVTREPQHRTMAIRLGVPKLVDPP
ncbi:MAG TPA: hypothetical protein VE967_05065 [Gemmatimonadaceae bacterium]|nr:hypothetical protein [Gemmatimonadaceae bacterium]